MPGLLFFLWLDQKTVLPMYVQCSSSATVFFFAYATIRVICGRVNTFDDLR